MQESYFKIEFADINLSTIWYDNRFNIPESTKDIANYNELSRSHSHPSYEVFFVTEGKLWLTTESEKFLCENSLVIIPPGLPHYTLTEKALINVIFFNIERGKEGSKPEIYEKLNTACRLIRNGAEYISTHPDLNCPTEDGFIPDSGAIAALVTASTGVTPTYFGKPYKETVEMITEYTGYSTDELCIFGDRLYTDIALGKSFGVTACLVLSGETKQRDVDIAKESDKPDLVFDSLEDVNRLMFNS